jgi:pimeloyl-ACP methyl ester carboxylesterase
MSPGFVLVHGGGHGAWCWDGVIPHLNGSALAVDLPGRYAPEAHVAELRHQDFVASVVADIKAKDLDEFVLVGHSMAGGILPGVAAQCADRVRHLVFVSCIVPAEGGILLDIQAGLLRFFALPFKWRLRQQRVLKLPSWMARWVLCNDQTPENSKLIMENQCFEPVSIATERITWVGVPQSIPRTYVKLLRDRALPPSLQEKYAANLGSGRVVPLDAGHDAMISRPRELADILNRLANGRE